MDKNIFLKNEKKIFNFNDFRVIKDLSKDSYSKFWLDNTFSAFKSINNILYLIYAKRNNSIICYNLINNKIINEIKNAHYKSIINFRHYLDKNNYRDLILTISAEDNNIKIWNINNWECLFNIKKIYNSGYIYSACILNYNNEKYIIASNCNYSIDKYKPIKILDKNGNILKEIKDSKDNTFFINKYYNNKLYNYYIITGNSNHVKSYDFKKGQLYHKYYEIDSNSLNNDHFSIIIIDKEEIIKMIESSCDGNIRIWNFHSGELLNKIKVSERWLKGICLWNDEQLFVGSTDEKIIFIDFKKVLVIKNFNCGKDIALTIKKINHPKYGECLITQGLKEIKLWINKKC